MKQVAGIWLPDDDTHFAEALPKQPKFKGAATYQLKKLQTCLEFIDVRRQALDIGAHVGLWSRVLADTFDQVIAFEPVPELVVCFGRNTEGLKNVTLVPYAAGNSNSKCTMIYTPGNSGNSHVSAIHPMGGDSTTAMVKIDSFYYSKIDFIKIDTEGFEMDVLEGAEKTIKYSKPIILIEQKPGNAERYGLDCFHASNYLEKHHGMKEFWHQAGDYCYGWC